MCTIPSALALMDSQVLCHMPVYFDVDGDCITDVGVQGMANRETTGEICLSFVQFMTLNSIGPGLWSDLLLVCTGSPSSPKEHFL